MRITNRKLKHTLKDMREQKIGNAEASMPIHAYIYDRNFEDLREQKTEHAEASMPPRYRKIT